MNQESKKSTLEKLGYMNSVTLHSHVNAVHNRVSGKTEPFVRTVAIQARRLAEVTMTEIKGTKGQP